MTDNEIIKAFEWCEQFENNIVMSNRSGEKFILALQAMQIIKQALKEHTCQKAEIINRTEEYNDMLEQRNKVEEALEIKTMDVNSLTRERDALQEMVAEQKAEKERLEYVLMAVMHSVDKLNEEIRKYDKEFEQMAKMVWDAEAEAYKKFAEKLKAYFNDGKDVMYMQTLIHSAIDNLVEEMTEGRENG